MYYMWYIIRHTSYIKYHIYSIPYSKRCNKIYIISSMSCHVSCIIYRMLNIIHRDSKILCHISYVM